MTEEHLGGYWPGGDPYGWTPSLWRWLVEELGVRTVLDVGAGEGLIADFFRQLGCSVDAIDGVPREGIITHDYTTGPFVPESSYDLCWSCEFVEHVEERYVSHFLTTFRAARLLLMTHAVPGQIGHHHVNCRQADYWLDLLAHDGWWLDLDVTRRGRQLAEEDLGERNYFSRTGLAFRRHP